MVLLKLEKKVFGYAPASTSIPGMHSAWLDDSDKSQNRLTWFTPDAIMHHNFMLVSAHYGPLFGGSANFAANFRDKFNVRKNVIILADSGGFQALTQKIDLQPLQVLKWQEANADIGFSLDRPPLDPVTLGPKGDFEYFKKCADESAKNLEEMIRNKSTDFKLFGILQGSTKRELDYWYRELENHDLDGVTVSPKPPNDPMQTAIMLGYILDKKVSNTHILLSSGSTCHPVNIYASKYFDWLTFDSSSYMTGGGQHRKYFLPYHHHVKLSFISRNGELPSVSKLPCDGPICQQVEPKDLAGGAHKYTVAIGLHNLYVYVKYVDYLHALKDDREAYFQIFKDKRYKRTLAAIEFLELCIDKGFEKTYKLKFPQSSFSKGMGGFG